MIYMPVYKDADGKKWRAVYRIKLRDGSTKQKSKRGFRTKKEAISTSYFQFISLVLLFLVSLCVC